MWATNQPVRILYKPSQVSLPIKALAWFFFGTPVLFLALGLPLIVFGRPGWVPLTLWVPGVLFLLIRHLRKMGAPLEVDPDRRTLTLRLGPEPTIFDTTPVVDVDVETSPTGTQFRLIFVHQNGHNQPLTPGYFYGLAHHQKVAAVLRTLLVAAPLPPPTQPLA